MKKSVYLPLGMGALIVALLFTGAIALPRTALAWDSPCQLQPGISMTTADLTVLPDGTVFGAFVINNVTSIYSWKPPSCSVTRITDFAIDGKAIDAGSPEAGSINEGPEVVQGPTQNVRPDIDSNAAGDVVVAYRTGTNYSDPFRIYFSRKAAKSGQFGNSVLVAANAYAGDVKLDNKGNVHIVYFRSNTPGTPGAFYQRFDANNNSVIGPIHLTGFRDATPEMDLDSKGNAHIVYVDDDDYNLRYVKISKAGVPGAEQTITTSNDTFFPYIAVDSQKRTHIVWEGRAGGNARQIFYRMCDKNGQNCSSELVLSQGGVGQDGHVVACGAIPFISWYVDNDTFGNHVYVSKNLAPGADVSGNVGGVSAFNVLAPGNKYMNVVWRGFDSRAYFTRQQEPDCTNETPTKTPTRTATPTVTNTPTITQTPTDGPTPTPTDPPTVTPTPTETLIPKEKYLVDDSDPAIAYNGKWKAVTNGPSCLYPDTPNTMHTAKRPKKNRATYSFDGTRVKVWYLSGPEMGKAQILIDGVRTNVNMQSAQTKCLSWFSPVLPDGNHTIVIRPKGKTQGKISLDVLTIYP